MAPMIDSWVPSAPPTAFAPMADIKRARPPQMQALPRLIFMTRWLQVPLYVGLIVAPEWLSHVNASVLKVKLATAIIGISSIHG